MAKENKKAALSLEERLDAALVPDWEQPHKVPANWCWTYIRTGFIVSSSKRVHKNEWQSDGVPFYRTRELVKLSEHGFVDNELFITLELYEQFKKNYGVPSPGDLLVSGVGTIGVPYVIDDKRPFYFKDGNIIWLKNRGVFFPQYIYYLYKSTFMYNQLHAMSAGTTVDTYTIINAENTMLPLPPYAEQQRIVDRIESLFAKLDEAKEKAQEVVDGYDARRAAILHRAFTGELTAGWRIINGIGNDVVLRLANLSEDGFDETDLREIVLDEKEQKSYELHSDDVLMVRVNGSKDNVGKQYQVTNQKRWAFCDHIIRIRYANNVLPHYMVYFSKSSKYRQYIKDNMVSTAGQNTISRKGMARLQVPVPTIDEQEKIASILTDLFEKEQQAVEAAKQVLDQIDTMKKAILARAFRGELGTNDPTDESAIELLKETLNIEKTPTKRAKAVVIPKGFSANLETELEKKIIRLFYQKDTKELPIKDIITVSSKTFDVLDCLRGLERRQLITKLENGNYRLMG